MIEKTIESKLVALFASACPGAQVVGFWQDVAEGLVKIANPPFISVTVLPKSNEDESMPAYSLPVHVQFVSPVSDDARGTKIAAWSEAVFDLMDAWNSGTGNPSRAALQTALGDTGYAVESISETGGDAAYDQQVKAWYVLKTFDLHVVKGT